MANREKEKEKTETSKKEKDFSEQNPIDIASKAIQSDPTSSLPPTISLGAGGVPADPLQMKQAIQDEMIADAFSKLRWNMVDGALAQSEAYKAREEKKRLAEMSPSPSPASSPAPLIGVGVPGGLIQPHNDRAAIVDAALKNLTSDEAKLEFLNKPPEWLSSPVNVPGSIPRSLPSASPVPGSVSDPVGMMRDVGGMLVDQLRAGMDIQKAISPQQNVSGTPNVIEVIDKFKEINKTTTDAFSTLFKESQDQTKKIIEELKENNSKLQADVSKMQMDMIEKDRDYMKAHIERLESALAQPRVPYREVINEAKQNGVPVTIDTPEREKVRADIAREDLKLSHQLKLEDRKSEIEILREKRRLAAMNVATSVAGKMVSGLFGGQELKKHELSSDGVAVAQRFQ